MSFLADEEDACPFMPPVASDDEAQFDSLSDQLDTVMDSPDFEALQERLNSLLSIAKSMQQDDYQLQRQVVTKAGSELMWGTFAIVHPAVPPFASLPPAHSCARRRCRRRCLWPIGDC